MADIALTSWYDHVVPYVNGCPLPVALQKIRQATIEFLEKSRSWRYLELSPIDVGANQATYVVGTGATLGELPAERTLVHVFDALYLGARLELLTPQQLKEKSETWFEDEGEPEAVVLFNDGELTLWPIPTEAVADALHLPEVALGITQTATTVDERIFQRHCSTIAKGAIGLIHQVPGKPYSDIQLGRVLHQDFIAEASSADLRAASGRSHARLRTRTISR